MKTITTKIIVLFGICLIGGLLGACALPDTGPEEIHYDGPNHTTFYYPSIGSYMCGVRLTPAKLAPYAGRSIVGIKFYLVNLPTTINVRLYGNNSATQPGGLIISAYITPSSLTPNAWNEYTFYTPTTIPVSGDIWVGVDLTAPNGAMIMGLDAGPVYTNGDFAYTSSGWGHVGLDANLNIRALVE